MGCTARAGAGSSAFLVRDLTSASSGHRGRLWAVLCLALALAAPAATFADSADPVAGMRRLAELRREGKLHALVDAGSGITRDIGSIAVIEHDGSNYDMEEPGGVPNYAARVPIAQRFYETHGDNYDFLVVFTNFTYAMPAAEAVYFLVRNDVRGIGRFVADNGVLFGSPGRLKGYIDMSWVDRWRQPP